MPRTLKLTLAYDGTDFAGWQRQARERTVQAVLEETLAPIAQSAVTVIGAGRTDAGVHAAGQVASLAIDASIACEDLRRALNATLPDDVRVLEVEEVAAGFSARRDARLKTYHYSIWNGAAVPPALRRFVWHVPQPIDLTATNQAAAHLVGRHDFAAFQATGSDVTTTERRLLASWMREVDVTPLLRSARGDRLLRYEVSGTGFLRHMVRNIVGTLIDVGRGRAAADWVHTVLISRDRAQAGATAPSRGLVLWQVEY